MLLTRERKIREGEAADGDGDGVVCDTGGRLDNKRKDGQNGRGPEKGHLGPNNLKPYDHRNRLR